MSYFVKVNSLEDLKKQYRTLALAHHPDVNGDAESLDTMKAVNLEYDTLYAVWIRRANVQDSGSEVTQTASKWRSDFYTQNGWKGERHDCSLTTKEISSIIRGYVKKLYPQWRFSVTCKYFSGGSSISIYVMQAPYDIFDRARISEEALDEIRNFGENCRHHDRFQRMARLLRKTTITIDLDYLSERDSDYFVPRAFAVLRDVYDFAKSYRFDDSDGSIDYFHTNFYMDYGIGKYDKGFKVVERVVSKDSFEMTLG